MDSITKYTRKFDLAPSSQEKKMCFHFSVRGSLISIYDPTFNLGTFVSFMLGNYLSCMAQVKIQLIPQLIFLIALFFLPESPEFLRARNKKHVNPIDFSINAQFVEKKWKFQVWIWIFFYSAQSNRWNFTKELKRRLTNLLVIPFHWHKTEMWMKTKRNWRIPWMIMMKMSTIHH